MPQQLSSEISQAVFHTLVYSDVFDFPLTAQEVHRYLSGRPATYDEVLQALNEDPRFVNIDRYFTLSGREEIVEIREQREWFSKKLLPYALKYGRVLGSLPFVRMVALTGSLAVLNVAQNADFDYMLVTRPGRLWTARAFVLLFGRLTRRLGHTICPNLIVTEDFLEWHRQDLYSARELCQMIPITGFETYRTLMQANQWVSEILPNAFLESSTSAPAQGVPGKAHKRVSILEGILEFLLRGKLGDRFEQWEMNRKIARFARQEGFGEETIFNANICQGNFDHHRQRTKQELEQRINEFKTKEFGVRGI